MISVLSPNGDVQCVSFFTKSMFLFILKHCVKCLRCRLFTTFYSESRTFFVYTSNNEPCDDIWSGISSSSFDKTCGCCKSFSRHEEILTLFKYSKFSIKVINRFNYILTNDKHRSMVKMNECLNVSSTN